MKQIIFSLFSVLFNCLISNAQSVTQLTGFDIPNSINTKYIKNITRINDNAALVNFNLPAVLWRSDGTKSGSFILHDWTNEYSYDFINNILGVVNDKAIMLVPTDSLGKEIWVSDGTVTGTHLLVDFVPGKDGLMFNGNKTNTSIIINNDCYFLSIIDDKYQLMKTDGTVNGTEVYLKDIDAVDFGVSSSDMPNIFKAGDYFYFVHGEYFYRIDYKNKTTIKLALKNGLDILDIESISDTSLIFVLDNYNKPSLNNYNLNTNKIESLKVFTYTSGLYLHKILYRFNNAFYFCGEESTTNIYKTDGTAAGTKTIKPVEKQADIFIEFNNKLWFENYDNTLYAIFSLDTSGNIVKELDSGNWAGGAEKGFVLLDDNRFLISGYFKTTGNDWEPHIFDPLTSKLTKINANPNSDSYPELFTKLKDHNYLFYGADPVWNGSLYLLNLTPNGTTNQTFNQEIQVYPNPANISWTVESKSLDELKSANYKILDMLGNELKSGVINNVVTNIDASSYNKGIYFLEIHTKHGQQTIKLVKQ